MDTTAKLYPPQDPIDLGDYFLRHLSAMTVEGLRSKADIAEQLAWRDRAIDRLREDAEKYRALSTPEIRDFIVAVEREALHQRERWGANGDEGKTPPDWFWLVGYLAGKALHKPEKRLHHIITAAAALMNWHAAEVGTYTQMRPGRPEEQQT